MWSKNLTSAHTKDRSSAIHKGSFVRQSKSAAGIERELLWRISGERCGRSARPVATQECTDCTLRYQSRNVYINIGQELHFFLQPEYPIVNSKNQVPLCLCVNGEKMGRK
jgi:hypothetical protein